MSSAHSRAELKRFLLAALDSTYGLSFTVRDGPANARSLAISTFLSIRREILDDYPTAVDLQIKPVPYTKDQIAIFNLPHVNGEDL